MAKTRKNTRVDAEEPPEVVESDMVPVRKSPRAKKRERPPSSSTVESTPSKLLKKEPGKRGRKKKTPDDGLLLIDNKVSKLSATRSKLDLMKKPVLTPESSKTIASISVSNTSKITENDILSADDLQSLMKLINSLVTTQQDVIFEKYRQTSRVQMNHDSQVISSLREELRKKQTTIDTLQAQLLTDRVRDADTTANSIPSSTPKKPGAPELYESPIRKKSSSSLMIHQEDLANELKTIGLTLDMQELLTGVRITNYEEDRDKFYFDVKQTSTNIDNDSEAVSVVYGLVIKKKFEQTAEVTYVPSFLQGEKSDDARKVSGHLPEYLKDNLIFPYNTLLQFYAKMSKALNKSAKA